MRTSSGSSPSSPTRRSRLASAASRRQCRPSMTDSRNLLRFISAVAALGMFIGSWALLHWEWFARGQIIDTPVYENYGNAMATWHAPYLDFGLEYPPGALPAFLVPAIGHEGDSDAFRRSF